MSRAVREVGPEISLFNRLKLIVGFSGLPSPVGFHTLPHTFEQALLKLWRWQIEASDRLVEHIYQIKAFRG